MSENNETLIAFSQVLQAAAEGRIDQIGSILIALATVGVLAFAIIETLKALPIRKSFNNLLISRFIRKRASHWDDVDEKTAKTELEKLAIGGQAAILYMLPIDKLAGQINAAAQTALAYPSTYQTTIKILASLHDNDQSVAEDISTVIGGMPEQTNAEAMKTYTAARTRVSSLIQRNLDSIQILTNRWWTLLNQGAAIFISIALIFALTDRPDNFESQLSWFFIAAFGGMIAPVAKDILAKLKRP